ncbi:MAG: AAA family ATPase [Kineosporiaceae bacterium]
MTTATDDTTPDLTTELRTEREHLARSQASLRDMRERAEHHYATGAHVVGDSWAAERLGIALTRRLAELVDLPDTPLFFGRLDLELPGDPRESEDGDTGTAVERHHIGRRHVVDNAGHPLVLDWRAPVSRAFYRAGAADPQGVHVRRRFGFRAGELTSFEDEHLSAGEERGLDSRLLAEEIERPRVGPMRDIVATIQPEQDELVRADLDTSICVQGAPGTGKTAVGLHRAAYLLFAHRERLTRAGVLVVGPNRAFLGYITAVLPTLGELDVAQTTLADLLTAVPVRGEDPEPVAVLKHDPRMARVLHRAVWAHVQRPQASVVVSAGAYRYRLEAAEVARIVDDVRREGLPYLTGRERVRARIAASVQRQAEERGDAPPESWVRKVARSGDVTTVLDAVWPALRPAHVVHALLTDADALAAAASGVLDDDEQRLLLWAKPPRTPAAARWSAADAVLVDEVAGLLERSPGVGHLVVDEAQDLSPMQLRALARRCGGGSVTVLGDLAQGTTPWASRSWRDSLTHLGRPDAVIEPLTLGFRVPEVVVSWANRLLPSLDVDVPAARSVRADGQLRVLPTEDVAATVVEAVRAALDAEGSVGVIAADAAVPALVTALEAAGLAVGRPDDESSPGGGPRVVVVPATLAKGLEYDHVVAVEPAAIVEAEARGLHRLYVVLTRAVSRLDVVHARPLPDVLA